MLKRNVHVGLVGAALLAFVAACSQPGPTGASSCDEFGAGCTAEELQTQLISVEDRLAARAGRNYTNIVNPELLQCQPQSYTASAKIMGPGGGVLMFGPHKITFPSGALSHNVVVSGKLLIANHVVVELSPHGLQLSAPAALELNYGGCQSGGGGLEVAYVDNNLNIISYPDPPSGGSPSGEVQAELWHFSKYAVAY
jgi:hypothetical protein